MFIPTRALIAALTALLGGGAGSYAVSHDPSPWHDRGHQSTFHQLVGDAPVFQSITGNASMPDATVSVPSATGTGGSMPQSAMPAGEASVFTAADGDLSLQLRLTGLSAASDHSLDVEEGACPTAFRVGQSVIPPVVVQADAAGEVTQTIDTGRQASTLPDEPLALTVRRGVARNVGDGGQNAITSAGLFCAPVPTSSTTSSTSTPTTPMPTQPMTTQTAPTQPVTTQTAPTQPVTTQTTPTQPTTTQTTPTQPMTTQTTPTQPMTTQTTPTQVTTISGTHF